MNDVDRSIENLADTASAMNRVVVASADAIKAAPDLLLFWGSDCVQCGNATPDMMRCDSCGSTDHTVPLFRGPREGVEYE